MKWQKNLIMTFDQKKFQEVAEEIKINNSSAKLMIVSKNRPIESIEKSIDIGHRFFGENKVQEADAKFNSLRKKYSDIELHMIGPLQSNKTGQALKVFDVIQSLDREKLVKEILKFKDQKLRTKYFFVQINIGEEKQKSGVFINEVKDFYNYCIEKKLSILGFMCIPPDSKNPEIFFEKMLNIKNSINKDLKLSMGMSGDYKIALQKKTDILRIGSMFFK